MDFNIKKENRKKFQDKSKLKRHHKKNYAKVVKPTNTTAENISDSSSEGEAEEFDEDGNPILHSSDSEEIDDDGEPQLDEDGNVIPKPTTTRRRRKKKLQSNAWRYKEELEDLEDDDQNGMDDLMKEIIFNKLSIDKKIDLGGHNKKIDIRTMGIDEIKKIKIIDQNDPRPKIDKNTIPNFAAAAPNRKFGKVNGDNDPLDELLGLPVKKPETEKPKYSSKTPEYLKSDEAFLDDLL